KKLAEAIADQEISIDLISTVADGLDKLSIPTNEWIREEGYCLQYFDCFHRNDFVFSSDLILWVAKNLKNYDVVHTHNVFSPMMLAVRWLCDRQNIPYITTTHGMLEPWALANKSSKKKLYYEWFEAKSLQKSGAIHTLNQQEFDNIQALGFSHLKILPNGIRQSDFERLPDPEIFYQHFPETKNKDLILFLSRVDPKKGLDLLIPAFGKIRSLFPNSHLVIAGPDSVAFLPTVESYLQEANCENDVTITGMLTGDLKQAALAAATVYALTSYSEGFSMSVLEAMASCLPCVITKPCNFPEAGEAGVAKVVDIDVEAIADALSELLADLPKARAMGCLARDFVFQGYTWNKISIKLIALYESLLTSQ
ncbi:MAG: glycosyltransferase, partial [Limnothrix sp. RL_2_0]|nr:glycosyltransferase [Limnothrix sp. RL_2_0]